MLQQIISIEPEKRTNQDIKIVSLELKQIEYFSNFAEKKSQKLLNNVIDGFAKQSQLERFDEGCMILKAGDKPDKFMILLEGALSTLEFKDLEVMEKEKELLQLNNPTLDLSYNFAFHVQFDGDKIIVRQSIDRQEVKQKTSRLFRQDTRIFHQESRISLDITPTSLQNINKSFLEVPKPSFTEIPKKVEVKKFQLGMNQPKEYKYQKLPDEYIQQLSVEVTECLRGTAIYQETLIQTFFDGPIFKYKIGKSCAQGEPLTPELSRMDQPRKKRESSIFALLKSSILTISLRQYDDLMKSIEKARILKNVKLLINAFDEGIRSSDLLVLMKELVKFATPIKLCAQQLLYEQGQPCQTLYAVVRGEFEISKEFVYEKDHLPKIMNVKESQPQSLYNIFLRILNQERKALALTASKPIQRSRTQEDRKKIQVDAQKDQKLLQEVGDQNYNLMQDIYKLRQIESNMKENRKYKQKEKWQWVLARTGSLIGEEGFSFGANGSNHQFSCRCVSSEGKIIAIRRTDIYRICSTFDWFAQQFLARSQKKSEWLKNRFQERLAMVLNTQRNELDPYPLLQHSQKKADEEQHKSVDQRVLDKYAQLTRQSKERDETVENAVRKKINISKRKNKNKAKQEPLNVIQLNADIDFRKYDQQIRTLLDRRGLSQSPSRLSLGPLGSINNIGGLTNNQSNMNSSYLRGSSPIKANKNSMDQLNQTIKTLTDEQKNVKHLAAEIFRKTMERTVNQSLKNPVTVYKSHLVNDSCVIYEDRQKSMGDAFQNTIGNDIGLIEYLVQGDKNQLRLQQHVINKNNNTRLKDSTFQVQKGSLPSLSKTIYAPLQFTQFSSLLHHVTQQQYNKVVDTYKLQSELKNPPITYRQLLSQRQPDPEISIQTPSTNQTPTPSTFIPSRSILRGLSSGTFSKGSINRVKIKHLHSQSRGQTSSLQTSRLESYKMSATQRTDQKAKMSSMFLPMQSSTVSYMNYNQSFVGEQIEVIRQIEGSQTML